MDPISSIAAGINTSFRLLEVKYQLKAVGEQVTDLLSTTRHVDRNLNEARRLRRFKEALLNTGERAWVDTVISDTDSSLRAVAKLIEPARVDELTKNSINLGHKVMWVFRDNPQVRDKHARLSVCHQSLTAVISCLYAKDVVIIASIPEEKKQEEPPPYDPQMEQLLNWREQRRRRKSQVRLGGGGLERPMSTGSISTETALTSPLSDFARPAEIVDTLSKGSPFPAIPVNSPVVLSTSPRKYISGRQISPSSAANDSMMTNPLGLFVGAEAQRGLKSTTAPNGTFSSLLQQQQGEQRAYNHLLPCPMSPSDYSTKSFSDATEKAFNLGTSDPDSNITILPSKSNSMMESDSFGSAEHYASFPNGSNISNVEATSKGPTIAQPINKQGSTLSGNRGFGYEGADGLQIREIEQVNSQNHTYQPYRPPSASNSSYTSLTSTPPSPPPLCYSAGNSSLYRPPRFTTNSAFDRIESIAELGTSPVATHFEEYLLPWGQGRSVDWRPGHEGDTGRASSVAQGSVRRGGRSWLMFHASRTDLGHMMG